MKECNVRSFVFHKDRVRAGIAAMTPVQLVEAVQNANLGWRNVFFEELCKKGGLHARYLRCRTDEDARTVVSAAALRFGMLLA